jgi:predicted amidohydrolase
MNKEKSNSRRNFLKQSSLGLGAGMIGLGNPLVHAGTLPPTNKMPRDIRVASIDLKGLWPDKTMKSRIEAVLNRMDEVTGMNPDIVCLPELFSTIWVDEQKPISEVAEDEQVAGPMTSRMAAFARTNKCWVVCPLYTKKAGGLYNSSLLLNRNGAIAGVYHKTHPVKYEMEPEKGADPIVPGATDQPVFDTDFGKVGMQICYDANWEEGWDSLRRKGADLVLFSSAFPGGRMLNYYARKNSYYIVSSTGGDARVIDISGNDLAGTSEFVRYAWATINLDKVNTPAWPTRDKLPDLFKKYGERLAIKMWASTGVITIESRDAQLNLGGVLKEFDIMTYEDLLKRETANQDQRRLAT